MAEPRKTCKKVTPPPASFRQFSITFESTGLLGLRSAERMRVVTQLARLLMLAAGVAAKESDDER